MDQLSSERVLTLAHTFHGAPYKGATSLSYSEPTRWHLTGIARGARGLTVTQVRQCVAPQQDLGRWTHGLSAIALPTDHAALSSSWRTCCKQWAWGRPAGPGGSFGISKVPPGVFHLQAAEAETAIVLLVGL